MATRADGGKELMGIANADEDSGELGRFFEDFEEGVLGLAS